MNGGDKQSIVDTEGGGVPKRSPGSLVTLLNGEVDPAECTGILAAFCFMTGFIDAISFSAVFVWCGFQTGNFIQLAVALARLWEPAQQPRTFHKPDQQALASLLAFNVGAFIGRLGDHIGARRRSWLVGGSFLTALMTMAAALAIWRSGQDGDPIASSRGDPAWTNAETFVALCFMSASLGVQGIMGKRLNTQFGTTIVLTTIWVELMADPRLFRFRERVKTRDHRLIGAGSLFLGGFISRALLAKIGAAGTLGIGTGIRVLITLGWFFVPGKL
ncbi:hypothetical protein BD626DRAFT_436736 [Schizophyllum amplum]|uniref:DUF1275 domain protein n=1 Tax=Schizophyllum amplum TaxID=97359 RepID=A0A550C496_9AGAR|nr:hypothetical protein BD626DRAFT_436736 [Auriculariopsis ampla]